MIEDTVANTPKRRVLNFQEGVAGTGKSTIHGILKLCLLPNVPFRCLHRGVAKQKLNS
jgi:hypothetical protein